MPSSDRAFRATARASPRTIGSLVRFAEPRLLPPTARLDDVESLDAHLPSLAPAIEADWVARVGGENGPILHVESQAYRDERFLDRVVRYHLHLALRHWDAHVDTVALWLRPPGAQRRATVRHGNVVVRITHIVLAELPAVGLLADPAIVCFAAGADRGELTSDELCARVAASLRETNASWLHRHMAAVAAMVSGRYNEMVSAMNREQLGPIVIEELVEYGFDQGIERGIERGIVTGVARGRAEAKLDALRTILDARGLVMTAEQAERARSCADLDVLDRWIARAATARAADEVFAQA